MSLKNFPSLAYKPVDNFYIFSTRHVFESFNVPYFVTKTIGFVFNVDRLWLEYWFWSDSKSIFYDIINKL